MDEGLDVSIDSGAGSQMPASEGIDIAELQNEAAALDIEPLDEGVDLGFNYDEVVSEPETAEPPYEPSTLENIINAGAAGAVSPSSGAQFAGEILAPPGAEEALAQGLQAGVNAAVAGSKGFMEATIRQHGKSPAAALQDIQINQAIIDGASNDTAGEHNGG